ncbi:Rpn14 [Kluyveromyces lactis]|nr:Rpn14 [Kluyveromyces lactis]
MRVEEWSICSEFDDILDDVRGEKIASDKIWVSRSSGEPLYDLEFDVRLDSRGDVGFHNTNTSDKISFQRVRPQLYELTGPDATAGHLASFQSPKKRFQLPSDIGAVDLTSIDITNVFDPEIRLVCGDTNGGIYVLRKNTGANYSGPLQEVIKLPEAHASHVTKTQFFPNGHGFLSSSIDMRLKIWDASTGTELRTFIGHTRSVNDFAMVDRGRNFVSASSDGSLKLWECSTSACVFTLNSNDGINCISLANYQGNPATTSSNSLDHTNEYNTEGKAVFAGHDSGTITFHDIYNRKKIFDILPTGKSACVTLTSQHIAGDDYYLFAGYSNGTIVSWDTRNVSKPVETLQANDNDSISRLFLAHKTLNVSSGVQFAFNVPVLDGKFNFRKLTHLIRPYDEVTDFCVDESHQNVWCVGKNGMLLKY